MIAITVDPIDVAAALKSIELEQAGAIDLFLGVVRNSTQARSVNRLEYEAYDRMAVSEMEKIANEAHQRWPILRYTIIHRKGTLQIGEIAILIGVATAHRGDAFVACRYIIDTIKQTVPIWKKEVFMDGEEWVNALFGLS
ncbi:molybdenum cofactor biosynthesis protein MoaE [Spirosoma endophyticum]|uniref:Molybdopterin synthase catalytic subunit n=1 Tax=Spirosoma endophyticum TaxID=662367 RepID=A0A1I1VMX0_9BACT|nr:molybdenum cofactor biosynthesis protein MoaE [Spirosoma endophyticum]SFD84154.1 molybdopterin synthase catalytic subunit [Spirosoma endophyticum]